MRSITVGITIAIAFLITHVSGNTTPDKGVSAAKIAQMSVPEIEEAVLVNQPPFSTFTFYRNGENGILIENNNNSNVPSSLNSTVITPRQVPKPPA